MATSVFTECDGAVYVTQVACNNPTNGIFSITFNSAVLNVPVTAFSLEQSTNAQFLHTINNFIYAYVFGDKIGELTVSGLGFVSPPGCPRGTAGPNNYTLKSLYNFYNDNRFAETKDAIAIHLGNCGAFWGYLTGMRLEIPNSNIVLGQWSMRFQVIPKLSGTP